METNFKKAVAAVLEHEGGYVDDPQDPGGETKYGISKRSYPQEHIKKLTKKRAREIYYSDYWQACSCDDLPGGVDILVFDTAVNQGPSVARRLLQRACGVTVDGIIGPVTLDAIRDMPAPALLSEYAARRAVRYGSLDTFRRFGLGWMRRLMDIYQRSLKI